MHNRVFNVDRAEITSGWYHQPPCSDCSRLPKPSELLRGRISRNPQHQPGNTQFQTSQWWGRWGGEWLWWSPPLPRHPPLSPPVAVVTVEPSTPTGLVSAVIGLIFHFKAERLVTVFFAGCNWCWVPWGHVASRYWDWCERITTSGPHRKTAWTLAPTTIITVIYVNLIVRANRMDWRALVVSGCRQTLPVPRQWLIVFVVFYSIMSDLPQKGLWGQCKVM